MENGIITKNGIFVPCDTWKHIGTAFQLDTNEQFILCRNDGCYNGGFSVLDIVGELNKEMVDSLFHFATENRINIDECATCDLEEELFRYKNNYFVKRR
jgi:hypothetical protein